MTWLIPALLLGLFGSAHCVLMCGGIAGALSSDLVQIGKRARRSPTFAYNAGRVAAYVALGAVVGTLGRAVDFVPVLGAARVALRLAAGLLLVGAGLWVAGAFSRFSIIERAGAPLWRRVAPFATRLARSKSPLAALGVGALWGLMPCGLVYAAFGLALASGGAASELAHPALGGAASELAHPAFGGAATGALVMAAFGLGTAPAMIATGLASARVAPAVRDHAWVRRAAGALVLAFGLVDVASASASLATPAHPTCACSHRAR